MQQIPHRQHRRDHLPDDRGNGRAHHAPVAAEDKDGVQDDVEHCARQRGDHGKPRAAVGTDDGIHGLAEHVERHAQRDIEEVFLRMMVGLGVHRAAEHGQNGIGKEQVDGREHKAADHAQHHRVAHALLCAVHFVLPKADADEGTAAVTDHDRDGQRHHREREHHRVGGIAVGAEVAGIGNEDLVHDVVQCADQQRNNARDRIAPHQLADALRAEKLIGMFHRIHLTFPVSGQKKTTSHAHATGFTHESHSLYGIIIRFCRPVCKGSFAQELCWSFCASCTVQTLWKSAFEAPRRFVVQ